MATPKSLMIRIIIKEILNCSYEQVKKLMIEDVYISIDMVAEEVLKDMEKVCGFGSSVIGLIQNTIPETIKRLKADKKPSISDAIDEVKQKSNEVKHIIKDIDYGYNIKELANEVRALIDAIDKLEYQEDK